MKPAQLVVLAAAACSALIYLTKQTVKGIRLALAFFRRIDRALTSVETQLYPNGGTSLRDAVNKLQEHFGIENEPSTIKGPQHRD